MADIEYSPATFEQPDWNPQERLRHHSGAFYPIWESPEITVSASNVSQNEWILLHPAVLGKYFEKITIWILNKTSADFALKVRLGESLDGDGNISTGANDFYKDIDVSDPTDSLDSWKSNILFKADDKLVDHGGGRSLVVGLEAMGPEQLPGYFQLRGQASQGFVGPEILKIKIYGRYLR